MQVGTLASDLNNTQFSGATNPDSALVVKFYSKALPNNFETIKQGRAIYQDVDMVMIMTPGDNLNIIDTIARDHHKSRFPLQWAHYTNVKESKDAGGAIGTPINQWPLVTQAQAEELKYLKFYTVDSVALASDAAISKVGMIAGMSPYVFREKAQLFLKNASDSAFVSNQADELKKKDEQIEAINQKHAAEMAEVNRKLDLLMNPNPGSAIPALLQSKISAAVNEPEVPVKRKGRPKGSKNK
jgi:hypothetical protein